MSKFDYQKDFDPNQYIPKGNTNSASNYDRRNRKTFVSTKYKGKIVNAATGDKYPYLIGSADEKRFFTVMIPFSNPNNVSRVIRKGKRGKSGRKVQKYDEFPITESVKIFYDTPEQYERHRNAELSSEEKEKWRIDHFNNYNVEKQPNEN